MFMFFQQFPPIVHSVIPSGFGRASSTSVDFRPAKFTPLHNLAASSAPLPVYEALQGAGALVEAKDAAGWNLLHFGAKHQNSVAVEFGRKNGLDPEEKVGDSLERRGGEVKEREIAVLAHPLLLLVLLLV